MRFCTHCGAQVPDNSKFCTACGTPIDAPDEATVVISSPEEGEFTAACWSPEPAAKPEPAAPAPKPEPAPAPKPEPSAPAASAPAGKGFFKSLWLYIKIIALAVVIVLAAVAIKGLFSKNPEEPVPEELEDDGFQNLSDLSKEEQVEYLESLLERTRNEQ